MTYVGNMTGEDLMKNFHNAVDTDDEPDMKKGERLRILYTFGSKVSCYSRTKTSQMGSV